ncbi:hypothetical protein [Oerskovia rustica]|uniref:Terminase small subunit n=1 Tax=Oerskovia rustica TaxID=2762237 RepID=A0ABR8RX53_9CELL|nr:hypothetical protein [Oerskovia rustica]MBD7952373.1 hypothetical protein [Oerskovia rustica]
MAEGQSIKEVLVSGDRLQSLRALRDRLGETLDVTTSARETATLSARLQDVLRDIGALETPDAAAGTPLDELRERRARRKGGAA